MRLIASVLMLMASMFASIGAVVYPARTNGNNTFYGTNSHIGPVIVGTTNLISNEGSVINNTKFTNGAITFSGTANTPTSTSLNIGYNSGEFNAGARATSIGQEAGKYASNSVEGVYIGANAGQWAPESDQSVFIGKFAGTQATNSAMSIFIGRYAGSDMNDSARRLMIHSSDAPFGTNGLIYGEFDNRLLRVNGALEVTNTATAKNFIHTDWKWVDILTSGDAIASNPTGDPPVLTQYGTSNYFGYAYFYNNAADGDKSYFTLQSAHKIATTNASNPNVWVEPHIHVTTTTFAAGTNATFRLDLYYGSVFGYLTNWYAKTNSVSMTNTYQHCVLSFGNLTNNAIFSGKSSVLFKGRIMRLDGGTGDIGANPVWVDSIDIHVPVTELGSTGQTGD